MPLTLAADPLPLRVDDHGTYWVGPTRVRLDSVVFLYNKGESAEQIIRHYPTLQLAEVHAVISYYLLHKPEVDAYIAEGERLALEARQRAEAQGFVMSQEKAAEIKSRFYAMQRREA